MKILKHAVLVLVVIFFQTSSSAQNFYASYKDSILGWIKVYNYKGIHQPKKVDSKYYSANQLAITDSFVNWMQASYMPKGGLGEMFRTVSQKLGPYNKNTAALPQSYGANAKTYLFLKYNSSRKLVPESNYSLDWVIQANGVPGWEIMDLSSPEQYYFTMPSFDAVFNGEEIKKIHDLSKLPNIKPYINFWIKNPEAGNGTDYVLICKDNRSPFIKLTKGEYLNAVETAIPRYREMQKKKIQEANPGNQRTIDYLTKTLDDKMEAVRTGVKDHREKYKNRLDEIALTTTQPSLNDFVSGRDIFSNGYLSDVESTSGRVPVYKVDSAMAARCKKDQPQWILMSWWWAPHEAVEKHMHESIVNNFNFSYLYNFFFDPEKVKGQSYKPLRSPSAREAVVATNASELSKQNAADRNVHFFDDFSTTPPGKKPIGWKSSLGSDGSSSLIVQPEGLNGNWALIRDYTLTVTEMKKPFPQNFILTFDVVATQNFTWGAKGLTFQLSKETSPGNAESFLQVRLRPGFDGRPGEAYVETKFPYPPGYSNVSKWMEAPGFSNNKKNNRVSVTIKKNEELLQVFIDNIKLAEFKKAIPAALLFNAMSFYSYNSGENDKYYISNIRISKD